MPIVDAPLSSAWPDLHHRISEFGDRFDVQLLPSASL